MGTIQIRSRSLLWLGIVLLFPFTQSCQSNNAASSSAASGKAQEVISNAKNYLGTEYEYGGMSQQGIDCSGLICTSFKQAGIKLPRTVKRQSRYGHSVSRDELRPGDLVFFNTLKNKQKTNHVGLITSVESSSKIMFIHASSSAGVIINNLNMSYYRRNFVKAVRPF